MAVAKLELLNLVAKMDDMDPFLRRLALLENIHLVNAMSEVDHSRFTLVADEDYSQQLIDMCMVKSYRTENLLREMNDKLSFIMRICKMDNTVDKQVAMSTYDFNDTRGKVDEIYKIFRKLNETMLDLKEEEALLSQLRFVQYLEDMKLNMKELKMLNKFELHVGSISAESRERLSKNYENITAAIMHIGEVQGEEIVLVVYPKALAVENERLLKSVFFREIPLIERYLDYPDRMQQQIEGRIKEIQQQLKDANESFEAHLNHYEADIRSAYSKLIIEKTVGYMKTMVATTQNFFYLAGWIPSGDKEKLESALEGLHYEAITVYKSVDEVSEVNKPPTKLNNNNFFKPFEILVNLYGVPSYFELDPTAIIGILYMIFFGAMFGDLGQGFVIACAGALLMRNENMYLQGGLLKRIGLSSMIFGTLYDSFFGFEGVISHLLIRVTGNESLHALFVRPLENTNLMLGASVVFGIFLLLFSFGLSIYNKVCHHDYQEALFGRNGFAGLILYSAGILFGLSKAGILLTLPNVLLVALIGISSLCLLFKEPLFNMLRQHRPLHHEPPVDYYVENGFELLDTFIGFTSNTLSFVRIGAFALNHVGLFIAFHTLAEMIGGAPGLILMTIIGNVMVIGLEGLIVFIQGLRLSYYEIFGKFFVGDGLPFRGVEIKNYDVR